jgi:hypothetical protein
MCPHSSVQLVLKDTHHEKVLRPRLTCSARDTFVDTILRQAGTTIRRYTPGQPLSDPHLRVRNGAKAGPPHLDRSEDQLCGFGFGCINALDPHLGDL